MGTFYVDTGGSATNSGSSDSAAATVSGAAATVAGSVVTLDGSPDLTFLSGRTSGPTQASIYLNDATNTVQKIFWITAYDDTAKTVTVSVAPTGVVSSSWAIDGQFLITGSNQYQEGLLVAGDVVVFNNSPAARAVSLWTSRNAGTKAGGRIKLYGKAGSRPILNTTGNNAAFNANAVAAIFLENLEFDCDGTTGSALNNGGVLSISHNLKISDSGTSGGLSTTGVTSYCEVTGSAGTGFFAGGTLAIGCYVHDNVGDGFANTFNNSGGIMMACISDSNSGRGFYHSGAPTGQTHVNGIYNCTIYGNGNSGIEAVDDDSVIYITNTICAENGNAAGEYNVDLPGTNQGDYIGFHAWNIFYHSGGGGGANLNNLTLNGILSGTEFDTDPLFTDAAGGDFSIGAASPAKAAGFPGAFLGSASTGYLDIGAVQRQESGAAGGSPIYIPAPNQLVMG